MIDQRYVYAETVLLAKAQSKKIRILVACNASIKS